MELNYYQVTLPMPPSINNAHDLTQARKIFVNGKPQWVRSKVRSAEYRDWTQRAGNRWNGYFPQGVPRKLVGRLSMYGIFMWNESSTSICGIQNGESSDIDNRIKCLADFLQHKMFENDSMIDEHHHVRRIVKDGPDCVKLRIYEIPDSRYDDPNLVF